MSLLSGVFFRLFQDGSVCPFAYHGSDKIQFLVNFDKLMAVFYGSLSYESSGICLIFFTVTFINGYLF